MSLAANLNEEDLEDDEFVVLIIKNEDETMNSEPVWTLEDDDENESVDNKAGENDDTEQYDKEFKVYHDECMDFAFQDQEEHTKTNQLKKPIHHTYTYTHTYSYIKELRDKFPELRNDESQLVAKVVDIMKSCKPEEPPEGYLIPETFKCSLCHHSSQNIGFAKRHYQTNHGPLYMSCYACGRKYRHTSALFRHETLCKAEDKNIVLKARVIYIGNKGRNLPKLPPGTKRKKKQYKPLNKHIFNCTECSATFKVKVALTAHLNLHLGMRPFQCDVCPAAYTSRPGLRRHMKQHNPESYICDTCGSVFHNKQCIIGHMDTHLPEKKYVCEYPGCNVSSSYKKTMKYHVDKVHLKLPKQFPCKLCNKSFCRADTLKSHIKTVHGLELMTRKKFYNMLPTMPDPRAVTANAALLSEEQVLVVGPDCNIKE